MKLPGSLRADRIGLLVVAASLGAIVAISLLLLRFQTERQTDRVRVQGVSLVRLLSGFSRAELVDQSPGSLGPLRIVRHTQHRPDFAYVAVVDPDGARLAEVSAAGILVPPADVGSEPSSWMDESVLRLASGQRVREFRAPVLEAGRATAHVRVGFLDAGYALAFQYVPFLASIALPVFLLAPVYYLLLRREIRPVGSVTQQLRSLADGAPLVSLPENAPGQLGEFVQHFNAFVASAQERLDDLESQRTGSLASARVLGYQKARLEAVLESLPAALVLVDSDGVGALANGKLKPLLGVGPDALVDRKIGDWPVAEPLRELLQRCAAPGPAHREERLELAVEGGEVLPLAIDACGLLSSADHGPAGTLFLLRRDRPNADADQSSEFVSHIAHELKSPLNVLRMYSETLGGEEGRSEQFRVEACNVIQDEVERLAGLISTLLSISKLESGSVALARQRLRLPEFLADALEQLSRASTDDALGFKLDAPDEMPALYVDKDLLRVALNNLLTNAIKYNRPGGEVELAAAETDDAVVIRVRDSGMGIASADLERVFDKFYRSDDAEAARRGGHGLGLNLARQIVRLHGGTLAVQSAPGEGSEFTIALPKTPALLQEPT